MGLSRVAAARVGSDIGGTFTDFVRISPTGEIRVGKRLTTPDDPARAVREGVHELGGPVRELVHGTTLITNALITRSGARTALLTTAGFRDTLVIGREQRYDIYDLFIRFPEPLVPTELRLEVDERIDRDGNVVRPLDPAQVEAALAGLDVEAVAICFLHAYRNPLHEKLAAEVARRMGLRCCASHEVLPEIREFDRTSTTVANAYVLPLAEGYIGRMESAGLADRLFLMTSSGGLATPATARALPIRLLESGPAAGALAAAAVARELGLTSVLAFDMGGTTAKACLIEDGGPAVAAGMEVARVHRFKAGSGLPVGGPTVDMIEIGAGGGSIARLDGLGPLRVGPESAGATPGPACYGRGGKDPTVTDADLLLGHLDPGYFLGGEMPLDRVAAEAAVGRLGCHPTDIVRVVREQMAAAARTHAVERGKDLRRCTLIAFGGAGPVHAVAVARILGMPEVIVPPLPGVASAFGLLAAPAAFEYAHSLPALLDGCDWAAVGSLLEDMEARGRQMVGQDDVTVKRRADLRLLGQVHELEVDVPPGRAGRAMGEALRKTYAAAYVRRFGLMPEGNPIQVLNWRVRVEGPKPQMPLPAVPNGIPRPKGMREVHGWGATPVFERNTLPAGFTLAGPVIIEERESTTLVGPGDRVAVRTHGHLQIGLGGPRP